MKLGYHYSAMIMNIIMYNAMVANYTLIYTYVHSTLDLRNYMIHSHDVRTL